MSDEDTQYAAPLKRVLELCKMCPIYYCRENSISCDDDCEFFIRSVYLQLSLTRFVPRSCCRIYGAGLYSAHPWHKREMVSFYYFESKTDKRYCNDDDNGNSALFVCFANFLVLSAISNIHLQRQNKFIHLLDCDDANTFCKTIYF